MRCGSTWRSCAGWCGRRAPITRTGGGPLCSACERLLEEAAGLHRGDFLEGFNLKDCPGFDRWQLLQRDGLLQETGWALERLTAAAGEAGRWEEAVERARRWLALDELHEPAHRALMFFLARAGKRGAALRQYEECARLLREELDQEPDERTRALAERIRQRRLEPPPGRPQPAARPPRRDRNCQALPAFRRRKHLLVPSSVPRCPSPRPACARRRCAPPASRASACWPSSTRGCAAP